ncbi:MAG TPA: ATP-binding protein [Methyloversatilis sp.]
MTSVSATPTRRLRVLLVAALAFANILVLALAGYSLYESRQEYLQQAQTLSQNVAMALDGNISNSIEKVHFALCVIADELEQQLAGKGVSRADMEAFLRKQEERLPEVEAFRVANADGEVILGKGVSEADHATWADRDYFIHHRTHDDHSLQVAKARVGRVSGQVIVGFSIRYNHPDGRFAGVVSAPITVSHFAQILSNFDIGPHGSLILRDADLGLIARLPARPDHPTGQVGNAIVSPELRKLVESGVRTATFHAPVAADGSERMPTFRRLSNVPMIVIASSATKDYLAGWKTDILEASATVFGFMLLSVMLGGILLRLLSEAEENQHALAERTTQLQNLIDALPGSVQFKDSDGRWMFANGFCRRMFGLNETGWEGLTDSEIAIRYPGHQSLLDFCSTEDNIAWKSGKPYLTEHSTRDGNGNTLNLEVIKVPLFDGENRRQGMITVGNDITERKRTEVELDQHRRRLEELVEQRTAALMDTEARASLIVESSADGLFGVDQDGLITFVNPAACRMLGHEAKDLIGRDGHTLFHHSRPDGTPYPREDCPGHTAMASGTVLRVDDEVYWHADGHAVPVMYAIHPMIRNGVIDGAVISFVDMSAQRAAARAREQALAAAEHLARVRSEFLANMSHEIRTPLNGVLGFAEIGHRHHQNSEKARDAFAKILVSGKALLGVVQDILDFSKVESGLFAVDQTDVDLHELIDRALTTVRDRAAIKGLRLLDERGSDLPATCLGDPVRLGQVLLNVLSNAVKFTERGTVTLVAARHDNMLTFCVSDTGIGMTTAQIGELFNPFHQADASVTRRFGGTGLGLAISKRILERMKGDIEVHSQPDAGTTVTFRIPYVPAGRPDETPDPVQTGASRAGDKPLAGISLLVAEDDAINRAVMEEFLIEYGARVVFAENGEEAVDAVAREGADAFHLVLMDIQMPKMDGYQATRLILAQAPGLPVVAQTAHAFSEEREKCFAAGMVGHLAKPVHPTELVREVLRHVQRG